jgi:5-methyltetrahydrofolate--homocysteine methyltransferase
VVADPDVAEVARYIDWTYFFAVWEMKGRYPDILTHEKYGPAARELLENAKELLDRIIAERLLHLRAAYGFWPANSAGDDLVVFADEERRTELARFPMLRQQTVKDDGKPNRSLADFVAPRETGLADYVGAFVVTAGIGANELCAAFEQIKDDYNSIMVKALADRLAEALAEWMHQRVRRDWGYGAGERFTPGELLEERFRGIRPAPGYPACPDHSQKRELFGLLQAESIGVSLTDGFAMTPAASVCGIYFAHPEARYFNIGRIGPDQVEDYARRRGVDRGQVEQWLAPHLAYEPAVR